MVPKAAKSKPPEQRILLELQFLKKISPNLQREQRPRLAASCVGVQEARRSAADICFRSGLLRLWPFETGNSKLEN